jgi:hypothetical protein
MTKDDYRRLLCFGRKRGDHCLVLFGKAPLADDYKGPVYATSGRLCGCGYRHPASIVNRRRIARRRLQKQFDDLLKGS